MQTVDRDSLGKLALTNEARVPVRDIRVAVTMVGGVALAIYEGGVAYELFRMVHGQGMYGLLKRLTGSHAYVDILSGTSAGGINNVCLAAALVNHTDLRSLLDTWIYDAGIDDLQARPEDTQTATLLRGDSYYFGRIGNQFDQLVAGKMNGQELTDEQRPVPSMYPNDGRDVDLYVTGTFFEGQPLAFFDQRGKAFYTDDNHAVFHLKHRPRYGQSHFHPDWNDEGAADPDNALLAAPGTPQRRAFLVNRLARIARTTSSLPGIFEPSAVLPGEMGQTIDLPPSRQVNYLLDGGFLNNRPLDLAIAAVTRRTSSRDVVRKIVFVEPVAVPLSTIAGDDPAPPNALEAVRFFNDVRGRQTLSRCLTELTEQRRRADTVREMRDRIRWQIAVAPDDGDFTLREATDSERRLWAETCLQTLRDRLENLWARSMALENVAGLARGHDLAATENDTEEKQAALRQQRDALQKLTRALYRGMGATCAEIAGAGAHHWRLEDIDTGFLRRQIERAVSEVRGFRFPQTPLQEKSAQMLQQAVQRAAPDTENLVQEWVRELNHLYHLTEVLEENVDLVLGTIPATAAYKAAAENPDSAQETLWPLLWDTLGCLLLPTDPATGRWLLPRIEPGQELSSETEREATEQRFYDALTRRSLKICAVLRGEAPEQTPGELYEHWRTMAADQAESAAPDPNSILLGLGRRMNERLNVITAHLAFQLGEPLRERAKDLQPTGSESGDANREERLAQQYFLWATALLAHPNPEAAASALNAAPRTAPLRTLDIALYPTEKAADLPTLVRIDLVYISPRSEQSGFSQRPWEDKIAGDTLANLGGFLKRSWRANDVLWGRLDAAGALRDMLLDPERIDRLRTEGQQQYADNALAAIEGFIRAGDPTTLPDNIPAEDDTGRYLAPEYAACRDALETYLRTGDSGPAALKWLGEILLKRHQLDILRHTLPTAVGAALSEYVEQNAAGLTAEQPPFLLRPSKNAPLERASNNPLEEAAERLRSDFPGPMDSAVRRDLIVEANQRAAATLQPPEATGSNPIQSLVDFFCRKYTIGTEDPLRDIPILVNLQRVSQALLVVLQLLSVGMVKEKPRGGRAALGAALDQSLLKPLRGIAWVLYVFFKMLAQGRQLAVVLLAALLSILLLLPIGMLFGLVNSQGATWTVLGIAALLALVIALFRYNLLAAISGALLIGGALLIAWGIAPAAAHSEPHRWLLPLGEILLSGALLLGVHLRTQDSRGRLWRPLPAAIGVIVLLFGALQFSAAWQGTPLIPDQLVQAIAAAQPARCIGALLFLAALFLWGMKRRNQAVVRRSRDRTLDLELAGTPQNAAFVLNAWTAELRTLPDARAQAQRHFRNVQQGLYLDFGFAASYALLLAVLCVLASSCFALKPSPWPLNQQSAEVMQGIAPLLIGVSLIAGLGDWIENLFLLALLRQAAAHLNAAGALPPDSSPQYLSSIPRRATRAAKTKFVLLMVVSVYILLGGLTGINHRLLTRSPANTAASPVSYGVVSADNTE